MKHIVSFSGGKDSTAMLLRLLEEGEVIDDIIYCDTGKDFPDMIDHINKVNDYIKKKYNISITKLKSKKNHLTIICLNMKKTRGKNKGKKRIWFGLQCVVVGVLHY